MPLSSGDGPSRVNGWRSPWCVIYIYIYIYGKKCIYIYIYIYIYLYLYVYICAWRSGGASGDGAS